MCLYVNSNWCKPSGIMVREACCTPDIELLAVSLRPLYCPREFPQLFYVIVYIHPRANCTNAAEVICKTIQKLDSISPDAPKFVLGDFNYCRLEKHLKTYNQ